MTQTIADTVEHLDHIFSCDCEACKNAREMIPLISNAMIDMAQMNAVSNSLPPICGLFSLFLAIEQISEAAQKKFGYDVRTPLQERAKKLLAELLKQPYTEKSVPEQNAPSSDKKQ